MQGRRKENSSGGMSWLRRIAGRTRRDRIRNEAMLKKLGQTTETLVDRIRERRLNWTISNFQQRNYIATWNEHEVDEDIQRHGWKTLGEVAQHSTIRERKKWSYFGETSSLAHTWRKREKRSKPIFPPAIIPYVTGSGKSRRKSQMIKQQKLA